MSTKFYDKMATVIAHFCVYGLMFMLGFTWGFLYHKLF